MGSSSPKPTNVLVVNMPELILTLHANRVRVELPHATSIGKDAEGRWCTSAFKECAPPLCHSLFPLLGRFSPLTWILAAKSPSLRNLHSTKPWSLLILAM